MKPLFYIIRKSFKNHLKELRHKPGTLILYLIILVSIIVMIISSLLIRNNNIELVGNKTQLYSSIVSAILLMVVLYGIYKGCNKGNSFFRLSDVNMVFTAPISPQKVLIYGFLKQLFTSFFIVFFLIFQLPNLKLHFPLINLGGLIIILNAFFLVFSMSIIELLTYSIASRFTNARRYIERIIYGIITVLIVGFTLIVIRTGNVKDTALMFLDAKPFLYIPFIGWFKQIFMSAILGINSSFYINLILIIAFLLILIYTMYALNTDYYEDVLAATESKEQLIKDKKAGKISSNFNNKNIRKIKNSGISYGPKAIFSRHILEYRKSGIPFIDKSSMFFIPMSILFGYLIPNKNINSILYFSIYLLFFLVMQGKWSQELSKPYIYLLPFNNITKVFYATLSDLIKHAIDGLILFSIAGIIMEADILTILLCTLTYTSFAAIYIYGDMLSRRLLGSTHSKNVEMFLKLFLILFVILPGIIISVIVSIIVSSTNPTISQYISYIVLLLYNFIISFLLIIFSSSIFEHLEMR